MSKPDRGKSLDINDPVRIENESLLGHAVQLQLRLARERREAAAHDADEPKETIKPDVMVSLSKMSQATPGIASASKKKRANKPKLSREMFPAAYHFEFFNVDDEVPSTELEVEISGYAVCGDWVSKKTNEKEYGVTIYFDDPEDADAAERVLRELGWDAWVEGL